MQLADNPITKILKEKKGTIRGNMNSKSNTGSSGGALGAPKTAVGAKTSARYNQVSSIKWNRHLVQIVYICCSMQI